MSSKVQRRRWVKSGNSDGEEAPPRAKKPATREIIPFDDDGEGEADSEAESETPVPPTKRPVAKQPSQPATKSATAPAPTTMIPSKKPTKAPKNPDRIQSIKWTQDRERALALIITHEYDKYYLAGNKSECTRRWAKALGFGSEDKEVAMAQGKRVNTQVRAMVTKWNEVYKFENQTGNGDIETPDGSIVSLRQQCLDKCHYYEILYSTLANKQTTSMTAQLTHSGVNIQKPGNSPDQDEEEDDASDMDSNDKRGTSKTGNGKGRGTESGSELEDNGENETANKPSRPSLKRGTSGPTTPSASRRELLPVSARKGKDFGGLQALIEAPAAARRAKYEAQIAAQKTEQSKYKTEHAIKELEVLDNERRRRHELRLHNSNQEAAYWQSEMERIKLLISAGIPLSDSDKAFLAKPLPQPKPVKLPGSISLKPKSEMGKWQTTFDIDEESESSDDDVFHSKNPGKTPAKAKPAEFKINTPAPPEITTPSTRIREVNIGTPTTGVTLKRVSLPHPDEPAPKRNNYNTQKSVVILDVPEEEEDDENEEPLESEHEDEVEELIASSKKIALETREAESGIAERRPIMHDLGSVNKTHKISERNPPEPKKSMGEAGKQKLVATMKSSSQILPKKAQIIPKNTRIGSDSPASEAAEPMERQTSRDSVQSTHTMASVREPSRTPNPLPEQTQVPPPAPAQPNNPQPPQVQPSYEAFLAFLAMTQQQNPSTPAAGIQVPGLGGTFHLGN